MSLKYHKLILSLTTHLLHRTMRQAAVALSYDIFVIPKPTSGRAHHKSHEIEEHKTSAAVVAKIFEGKLAQEDVVIDTQPFHGLGREVGAPVKEIACIVM